MAMDDLAAQGQRTLLFGKKLLSEQDVVNVEDIDSEVFENGLTLMGCTGLEDLLQDDVKSCILDFKKAHIKVWMLTGDKGETAQNIGISCGIIDID